MSFGVPVRNGIGIGLRASTALSSERVGGRPAMFLNFVGATELSSNVTFTRGSNATLVDSTGKITYAPANLLTYSQQFDNAAWTKVTSATVTANTTIAPDGTSTADTLDLPLNLSRVERVVSGLTTASYIFSVYVKGTSGQTVNVELGSATQTVTLNGDWQRISVTNSGSTSYAPTIIRRTTTATSIFVWGAQLEPVTYQTTPSTYVATTTSAYYGPRFDYDPATLAPKGLLIEEARTNLALQSQTFDNAYWTKNDTTVTADATVSPDGATNADKLVETATTAVHKLTGVVTTTNTNPLTLSCYLKAGERTSAALVLQEGSPFSRYSTVTFNLSAGTASAVTEVGGASASSATITPAGNGWYRCTLTTTLGGAATSSLPQVVLGTNLTPYLGVAGNGAFIWGAQLEAGAFATSYIPTVASQVTRSADVATMTGTNFSSWYNQSEGTFVFEGSSVAPATLAQTLNALAASDGTNNNINRIGRFSNFWFGETRNGNVQQAAPLATAGSYIQNTTAKVAYAYKTNDFALSANGATAVTDTSGTVPTVVDRLLIGGTATELNGHIRQIAYYNTRLPNATLQALTA